MCDGRITPNPSLVPRVRTSPSTNHPLGQANANPDAVSLASPLRLARVVLGAAFELWCWKRLLKVPWMARRSNQSILREIKPEYSLEGLLLKLKLQYFGQLI